MLVSLNQHICFTICFAVTVFKENTSEVRLMGILNNTLGWRHLRMGRKCQTSHCDFCLIKQKLTRRTPYPILPLWSPAVQDLGVTVMVHRILVRFCLVIVLAFSEWLLKEKLQNYESGMYSLKNKCKETYSFSCFAKFSNSTKMKKGKC